MLTGADYAGPLCCALQVPEFSLLVANALLLIDEAGDVLSDATHLTKHACAGPPHSPFSERSHPVVLRGMPAYALASRDRC